MIKVKTFVINSNNPMHHERMDAQINKFIEENDIEVVDIKYSTTSAWNGAAAVWIPSAMLIDKLK